MKKLIIYLMGMLIAITASADIDAKLDSARASYDKEEFAASAEIYESILSDDKASAGVHYNLGNACFELQEWGKAILNYERALRLDPGNEDIIHNLEYVRTKTRDRIEYKKRKSLGNVITVFMTSMSPNFWGWLTVALWFIGFIGLIGFLYASGSWKRISFYGGLTVLLLAILSTALSLQYKGYLEESDEGVVMTNISKVREAPAENGELVFELHEGTKVTILEENDSWMRVDVNGEMDGWLLKNDVERI